MVLLEPISYHHLGNNIGAIKSESHLTLNLANKKSLIIPVVTKRRDVFPDAMRNQSLILKVQFHRDKYGFLIEKEVSYNMDHSIETVIWSQKKVCASHHLKDTREAL